MRDPAEVPLLLVVAVLAIPLAVTALLGAVAARQATATALVYRCRRCDREFRRRPNRAFPSRCPHCRAGNWNR